MAIFDLIKRRIELLKNPEKDFELLKKATFESEVFDYSKLLCITSLAAAATTFIISLAKVIYLDVFLTVEINYSRFINYGAGQSIMLAYFYIIAGTAGIFIASAFLRPFYRKMKYVELLKVMLHSTTPLLLLGWFPGLIIPMLLWSVILFSSGIKAYKDGIRIEKSSIEHRE